MYQKGEKLNKQEDVKQNESNKRQTEQRADWSKGKGNQWKENIEEL